MTKFIAPIFFAIFALSTAASAQSLVENNRYKEYYLSFDNADQVTLTVQGERYRASRPHTMITIKEVADGLYIVDQDNLYYPAVAVYPPLPVVTMRDSASTIIEQGDRWSVRILVPANLEVTAVPLNIDGPLCLAYWTGFLYSAESDSCVEIGTSGCRNPFEFTTVEACEVGNLLK